MKELLLLFLLLPWAVISSSTAQGLVPFTGTVTTTTTAPPQGQLGVDAEITSTKYAQSAISFYDSQLNGNISIGLASLNVSGIVTSLIPSTSKNSTDVRYGYSTIGLTSNFDFVGNHLKISGSVTVPSVLQFQLTNPSKLQGSICEPSRLVTAHDLTYLTQSCMAKFFGNKGLDWHDIPLATFNNVTNILYIPVSGSFLLDPLTLDTSGQCHAALAGNNCTITITTSNTNDVCVIQYVAGSTDTASVADSAGNTFTLRYSNTVGSILQKTQWFATATVLTSDVFTFTNNVADDISGIVFCVSGASTSAPWDNQASLAVKCNYSGTGAGSCSPTTFSTSNANDMLITLCADNHASFACNATTGYTLIQNVNLGAPDFPFDLGVQYKVVSAVQSGATIPSFDTCLSSCVGTIAAMNVQDALVQSSSTTTTVTSTVNQGDPPNFVWLLTIPVLLLAFFVIRRRL